MASENESFDVKNQFGPNGSRRIESIYLTPDIVEQREVITKKLNLRSGEHVLDLGCGPGLLVEQIADVVGPEGCVYAFDISSSMLEIARRRLMNKSNVYLGQSNANRLELKDGVINVASIIQVYEFVEELERALEELYRVLLEGGRIVIMDTEWESVVWASADDDRMRRVIDVWDEHVPNPKLPRVLEQLLKKVGFKDISVSVVPLVNTSFNKNTYSSGMIDVIANFVQKRKRLPENEIIEWSNDLKLRGKKGNYFFSLNRYLFQANK